MMKKTYRIIFIHVLSLLLVHATHSQSVRISDAIDEGIACYKIETINATYFFSKAGGGFVSMIDNEGKDWISYNNAAGSAGVYRGIPNTGELHPAYTGGTTTTDFSLNVWHESVTIHTTRNNESVTWEFYPTYAKMYMESIGGEDNKFWVLYEGTPGGSIETTDSLHLSNGDKYSVVSTHPFGRKDIINVTDKAVGSEWMYVSDDTQNRSFFMAVTDDVVEDSYYLMGNNMTVVGFGRPRGSAVQLREDIGATIVIGLVDSKLEEEVTNVIDASWNIGRTLPTEIVSDDFSSSTLDTDLWTFEDPLGGATYEMTGNHLSMTAPEGLTHDAWISANTAVRMMQDIPDTDFELEVNFESNLSENMQYGLLIEEHDNKYIRFDVYGAPNFNVIVANIDGQSYDIKTNTLIGNEAPSKLRVSRINNNWTCSYYLGGNWITAASFEHAITLRQVGPFIGNSGNAPEHTALIDYFFNSNSPIIPEDDGQVDTAPPTISDVSVSVTPNSARITWVTDESVTSRVDYGATSSYTDVVELLSVRKSHSILLDDLNQNSTYNFQVSSKDVAGNETTHPNLSFATTTDYDAPILEIWHGLQQKVGHLGDAQDDFNLLGNVTDENEIQSLTYSLNGGILNYMNIGYRPDGFGDGRRLVATGDFNADIPLNLFEVGSNSIVLTATDNLGNVAVENVVVEYEQGNLSLPYTINWDEITDPQEVGQYVDGHWAKEPDGLHVLETGYDRLFLIGDRSWVDYEVMVPFTYHGRDPSGPNSGTPGVGFVMRFAGHVVGGFRNFPNTQPKWGYQPFGAMGWVRWTGSAVKEYNRGDSDFTVDHGIIESITPGQKYWMKMKCITLPDTDGKGTTEYSWKMWLDGDVEPSNWDWQEVQVSEHALRNGGVALVAHHVDATFGDVVVTSMADPTDNIAPVVSNLNITPDEKAVTLSWTTDEYSLGTVKYGLSDSYSDMVTTTKMAKSHTITINDLDIATDYHYQLISTDAGTNTATSLDQIFSTSPIVRVTSDDFSSDLFNTDVWELVDPQGGAAVEMTGSQINITIPAGVVHDPWTSGNTSTRIMQPISNLDFEAIVKLESVLSKDMSYGILIQESVSKYLRFDMYNTGNPEIFSAFLDGSSGSVKVNNTVSSISSPTWLKVNRTGDDWTYDYSTDGENWTTVVSFNQPIDVNEVGIFVGNFGSLPEHTAVVDYFFNSAEPIVPEDEFSNPVISDVTVVPSTASATISWTTDKPTTSRVDFGLTDLYSDHVAESDLVTTHNLVINGLSMSTMYHYQITSSDGVSSSSDDLTFTTITNQNVVSDDFSSDLFNTEVWELVDPQGGATVEMTGSQINIGIPAGVNHDLWTSGNKSTRIMQPISNLDFEAIVKFESGLSKDMSYGLLIQESVSKYLRFDMYNPGTPKIFSAFLDGSSGSVKVNNTLSSISSPSWLKVNRTGDDWTYDYSTDGDNWITVVSFNQPIDVNEVGIFVGNFGSLPEHTAVVDYFFNSAEPIVPEDEFSNPVISDVTVVPSTASATISWTTDKPTTSRVDFGLTDLYSDHVAESDLVTTHNLVINGLNILTEYHYQITSSDGASSSSEDLVFTTETHQEVVSDDFSSAQLDTDLWTLEDPQGGAAVNMTGTQVSISLPAGVEHDPWTSGNTSTRLMQMVSNDDFEVVAKFESTLSIETLFGIIVEETDNKYLRFDIYNDGSTKFFSAYLDGSSANVKANQSIAVTEPVWLKVGRVGDDWTYSYSLDSQSWATVSTFNQPLNVEQVGIFVGNFGSAPAYTALVDYFFNTSSPILAEDGIIPDSTAPVVSDISVTTSASTTEITWTTNEASTSRIDFGLSSSYGDIVEDASLSIDHSMMLVGLDSETSYHYQISSVDNSGNSIESTDLTFTTDALISPFNSDDFSSASLDTDLWSIVDPNGNATVSILNDQLSIAVPGGADHDAWKGENGSVRLMQSVDNTDMNVEAKFNTQLSTGIQAQGLLFEGINGSFVRFDTYFYGSKQYLFCAYVNGESATIYLNTEIPVTTPIWLRVARVGDNWTGMYSNDGQNWETMTSFGRSIVLSKMGPFAGNYGGNSAPVNVVLVDYISEFGSANSNGARLAFQTGKLELNKIQEEDDVLFSWNGNWDVDFELQQRHEASGNFETIEIIEPKRYINKGYSVLVANDRIINPINEFRLIQKSSLNIENRISEVIRIMNDVNELEISKPYPNPFDQSTQFNVAVSKEQSIQVIVYNMVGKYITTLYEGTMEANLNHTLKLDGYNLEDGVFIIKVQGEHFSEINKVFLKK